MTFEKGAESVAPRPGLAAGIQPPASALSAGRDLPLHGCKGGLVRDSIADIESFRPASPGWPASIGMGGRLPSESAAGLRRNQWPLCVGLRIDAKGDKHPLDGHGATRLLQRKTLALGLDGDALDRS